MWKYLNLKQEGKQNLSKTNIVYRKFKGEDHSDFINQEKSHRIDGALQPPPIRKTFLRKVEKGKSRLSTTIM